MKERNSVIDEETKNKMNIFFTKKNIVVLIVVLFIILFSIDFAVKKIEENNIDFYTLSGCGIDRNVENVNKFRITNYKELECFISLCPNFELSKDVDLFKYDIFVQTETHSSGSVKVNFNKININYLSGITFDIERNYPSVGTADMAYYCFVAIIPKNITNTINVIEWKNPIDVKNTFLDKYLISVKNININTNTSLNNTIKNIEQILEDYKGILLTGYELDYINKIGYFQLVSYDEQQVDKFKHKINTSNLGLDAKKTVKESNQTQFNTFKNLLNSPRQIKCSVQITSKSNKGNYVITKEDGEKLGTMIDAEKISNVYWNGRFTYDLKDTNFNDIEKKIRIINNYTKENLIVFDCHIGFYRVTNLYYN